MKVIEKDKIKEKKENIAKEAIKAANKAEREKSKTRSQRA